MIRRGMRMLKKEVDIFGEVDSVEFAIYLSNQARERQLHVNVTKIQKWLYICYGLFWAVENRRLLNEQPKAWDYGPAFPIVHKQQKKNNNTLEPLSNTINNETFRIYDDLIEVVLVNFGGWTASQLVSWTHEEGTAWDRQRQKQMYEPLDDYNIKMDFKGILENG